jgi:hypothetical protein
MNHPTEFGKNRWPQSGGFLPVNPRNVGDPKMLPCTCEPECHEPDCKGLCGCEACWLAWLVYNDDHAIWDEEGNLVLPKEKLFEGPWRRIREPHLVNERCKPASRRP